MNGFIRNPKDFWSGLSFTGMGSAALFVSQEYDRGSAGMMGPGYFPTALGALLAMLGLACMVRSLILPGESMGRIAAGKALIVLLAILLFGVLVRGAGLGAAIIVLVMIAGCANTRFRARRYLALAVGMTVFCALVFVHLLGLPLPLLGPWLGR